jgi:hypothetical protein
MGPHDSIHTCVVPDAPVTRTSRLPQANAREVGENRIRGQIQSIRSGTGQGLNGTLEIGASQRLAALTE